MDVQMKRLLIQQMEPRYRKASGTQKGALLDEIAATTGYARRYAMWLLNHPPEAQLPARRRRASRFGPEVVHALVLVWQTANQICAKRLIPFLPTLVETLERQGHLHLSEASRRHLLSMSAATADRLLRLPRSQGLHGLSTTRAGTLLKQQIAIHTFAQWNEVQPGFLEMDLVAHCGSQLHGSFLFTLTLTDIATEWTECVALRTKSAEAVLSGLQQARASFPFPILGIDTDNGSEFLNEALLAYCEAEQLTFTRGRAGLKNDQCFVEQKNGAVVRQVIGHVRLEGEQAYQQLGAIYQALRLYVNGFQPSMKLQAIRAEGRKVRRIYDAAKTPVQRLLCAQALSAAQEQDLQRTVHLLDPLRLLCHLKDLQAALITPTTPSSASVAVRAFCIENCISGANGSTPPGQDQLVPEASIAITDLSGVQGADVPRQMPVLPVASAACSETLAASSQEERGAPLRAAEGTRTIRRGKPLRVGKEDQPERPVRRRSPQRTQTPPPDPSPAQASPGCSLEQAIQEYLHEIRTQRRQAGTLEWHTRVLGWFEAYLRTQQQCVRPEQVTREQVCCWFLALAQRTTVTGAKLASSTVHSYARSTRAFCLWLVRRGVLAAREFGQLPLPPTEHRAFCSLESEFWEQLQRACVPPEEQGAQAQRATARNLALLWLLFETGMHASEVCALCVEDVDRARRAVRVRGGDAQDRWLTLGEQGWSHLRAYLDVHQLRDGVSAKRAGNSNTRLFLSETGRPLTRNGLGLMLERLRKRAAITREGITPSLFRNSFVARYLQAGGNPEHLRDLLGQQKLAAVIAAAQEAIQGQGTP